MSRKRQSSPRCRSELIDSACKKSKLDAAPIMCKESYDETRMISQQGNRGNEFECEITEVDIILFYVANVSRTQGFTGTIIIDAEDTDVVVQACFVAHGSIGTLGIKKKKQSF